MWKKPMKFQTKLTLFVSIIIVVVLCFNNLIVGNRIQTDLQREKGEELLDIAYSISINPLVVEALREDADEKTLQSVQELAVDIAKNTNLSLLSIANTDLIRVVHSEEQTVGMDVETKYADRILSGETFYIVDSVGALGAALKSFCPVFDENMEQIGVVSAAIEISLVQNSIFNSIKSILYTMIVAIVLGLVCSFLFSKHIKGLIYNLEPVEIAELLKQRNEIIFSVRDGIIATDYHGKITLVNREAEDILQRLQVDIPEKGGDIIHTFPKFDVDKIVAKGRARYDFDYAMGDGGLYVNIIPIVDDSFSGILFTFREKQAVISYAEEITGVKNYFNVLRFQIHEFNNKLHVINGLLQMKKYERLEAYMQDMVAFSTHELIDLKIKIGDPMIIAYLTSKFYESKNLEIDFVLSEYTDFQVELPNDLQYKVITIVGNLVQNAFEAVAERDIKRVVLELIYRSQTIEIKVSDTGVGIAAENVESIFEQGFTTKVEKSQDHGCGLSLVKKIAKQTEGTVDVTSEMGGLTEFVVKIPFVPVEKEQ